MSKDGFTPTDITIKKNTIVEFKNIDKDDHWPASDLHPTHDIYPEFDPQKPIKSGESWKFKAEKVGTWKFHDHLNPHRKGTLIVNGQASVKNFSSPNKLGGDYQIIQDIANSKGVEESWKYLVSQYGRGGTNPHDLAHFIGGLIYDKEGLNGMKICTSEFAFGCYHGLLDKAFLNGLDKLGEAEKSCLLVGTINSGPFASCIHGIGHGVASFFKTTDLNSALLICDKLTEGQTYCYDGVFMEFERNAPSNFYKSDDPLYPCNTLDQKYLSACGRNQPQVMINKLNLEFMDIPVICLKLPDSEFQRSCFESLGFIVAHNSRGQADSVIKDCSQIQQPQGQAFCMIAVVGELVFQNISGWQQSTEIICASLSEEFRKSCNDRIEQIATDYQRK